MCNTGQFVDYYKILQCDRNAINEELKKSYQRLALLVHPDKQNGEETESFILLQKAWNVLRDPDARKQYNAELACFEHTELLLYDSLQLKDMHFISKDSVYIHNCRCGGTYMLEEMEIKSSKVIIPCDECSFSIQVTV